MGKGKEAERMGQSENNNGEAEGDSGRQRSKKQKRKEVAIFGNYRNYYGYRVGQDLDEDPRLKVLKREWFEGKDCLDIGCNSGLITIAIAKKFGCHRILGLDIDGDRVADAYWNLRRTVRMNMHEVPPKASKLEDAEGASGQFSELPSEETMESSRACSLLQGKSLSDIVTFRRENFVQNWQAPEDKYHTILCLSVTKWIHLNWGDDGLITLFVKAWKLLKPGGILILEPQPWNSYYKNRHVSEVAKTNYHKIKIRPEDFQAFLLDKIGFRMAEDISSSLSGYKAGYIKSISEMSWKAAGYSPTP